MTKKKAPPQSRTDKIIADLETRIIVLVEDKKNLKDRVSELCKEVISLESRLEDTRKEERAVRPRFLLTRNSKGEFIPIGLEVGNGFMELEFVNAISVYEAAARIKDPTTQNKVTDYIGSLKGNVGPDVKDRIIEILQKESN